MNYFKAEIYKLWHNKTLLWAFISILTYAAYGNFVYFADNIMIEDLYLYFYEEYYILILFVSLFYVSKLFPKDLALGITYEYSKYQMYLIRLLITFLYILFCYFLAFILSYLLSLFIFGSLKIDLLLLIKQVLYASLSIFLYNLLGILISLTFKKETITIVLSYFIYIAIALIKSRVDISSSFFLSLFLDFDLNNPVLGNLATFTNFWLLFSLLFFSNIYFLKKL